MGPDASLRDAVAGAMRHASDAAQLLQAGQRRWTDALLSEARAHLSGCLNAAELAIGLALGDGWLARPVEALGPGYCRIAIERHPGLLSPLLVDHLRLRGAAALALRLSLARPAVPADEAAPEQPQDGPLADALVGYRFAVDPWFTVHPIARPMRADLAAEPFCELVWTAAALLVEGLALRMGVESGTSAAIIARAAEGVIAQHDEQAGPFARADYVATLAPGDAGIEIEAALRHDLLLVAALGGRRAGLALGQALALLVDGAPEDRAAFARLLGLDDAAYIALLDGLAPVLDATDDWALPDLLARYQGVTASDAADRLAPWRGPAPLVERLARMAVHP